MSNERENSIHKLEKNFLQKKYWPQPIRGFRNANLIF